MVKLTKDKDKTKLTKAKQQISSHINESFQAVNYSIKPSMKYRQLKLCEPKSIISERYDSNETSFAYYSIL